jgi:hypothetical protein
LPDPTKDKDYQALPVDHIAEPLWFKGGSASAFQVYREMWTHLNELIVFDDVDDAYKDRRLIQLLKAVCETEDVKKVGWHTANRELEKQAIPVSFKTRSRVCIIANHWRALTEHVGSLMSRGMKVEFAPSVDEVIGYVKKNKIITDAEILKYVDTNRWLMSFMDIRVLEGAVNTKKAKLPWQETLACSLGIRDMLLAHKLEADNSYPTQEARIMEFMRQTGRSRPMYLKAKGEYHELDARRKGKKQQYMA